MFISDRMTRNVIAVAEADTVRTAGEVMAKRHIHQLPVVRDGDRLVGIITDRDVRSASDEPAAEVRGVMTANPITVSPGEPLEEALLLLHRHRFGSLPVVTPTPAGGADGAALPRLVGIITRTDILAALIDMLGIEEAGTRLEVELPEGSAANICDAIDAVVKTDTRVISLIFSGRRGRRAHRLYLRLSTIDPRAAIDALADAGYSIADPFCSLI